MEKKLVYIRQMMVQVPYLQGPGGQRTLRVPLQPMFRFNASEKALVEAAGAQRGVLCGGGSGGATGHGGVAGPG